MFYNVLKVSMVHLPVCLEGFNGLSPSMLCNVFKVSMVWPPVCFAMIRRFQWFVTHFVLHMFVPPVCFEGFNGLSPSMLCNVLKVSMVCPLSMFCNILKGSMVCAPVCLTIGLCHSIFCNWLVPKHILRF